MNYTQNLTSLNNRKIQNDILYTFNNKSNNFNKTN